MTQKSAFAEGTKANLSSQWKKFEVFCALMGDCKVPISAHQLCLYIQYLSRSLKSPSSVRNYVSGLKTFHYLLGLPFPSTSELEVKLTFRGLDRLKNHVPSKAAPVDPSLLLDLHALLDTSKPHDAVVWCLFVFMFFLFARKSQFLPLSVRSVDLNKILLRSDVKVIKDHFQVTFRWTKTTQFGRVVEIPLVPIPNSPLCPVQAWENMTTLVPAPPSTPMFVMPRGSRLVPFIYPVFQSVFKSLVKLSGRDSSVYSSHSFRRGGASFALKLGLPGPVIQSQGNWASDAYLGYLDVSYQQRLSLARHFASALLTGGLEA